MSEYKGACKFCGQICVVDADENTSIEELDILATLQCTCREAVKFQYEKMFKDDSYRFIDEMIEDEEINGLMKAAADKIATHKILGASFSAGQRKYTIQRGKDGPKVSKTFVQKEQMG